MRLNDQGFVQQLADASGIDVLAHCTQPTASPPFVQISSTRTGEKIYDSQRLEELTRFLQKRAGLTFYSQLFSASASFSQLLEYEWVDLLEYHGGRFSAEADVVRKREVSNEPYVIKFCSRAAMRLNEMNLHVSVADAEFVSFKYSWPGRLQVEDP